MLNATFGNIPMNTLSSDWGLLSHFPSLPNLVVQTAAPTQIIVFDPVTGSTLALAGSFNYSSQAALFNSPVTAMTARMSNGDLLFSMDGFSITAGQAQTLDAGAWIVQLGGVNAALGTAADLFRMEDLVGSTATNDAITGGAGADTLMGGAGNDYIQGNIGSDSITGGAGNDELRGGQDHDVVRGGAGQDFVQGALGNDELRGGLDGDTLFAGQGNDSLYGGGGNDYLDGKANNDWLTGGAGADQFAFSNAPSGTTHADAITDFEDGIDKIVLDRLAFGSLTGLPGGALAAGNFVSGASAQDADDYILYDSTTHALSYDADGNGSGAAQQIAVLANGADLSAADILLV